MPYLQDFIASLGGLPAHLQKQYGLLGQLDQQFQEHEKAMLEKCVQGHKEVTDAARKSGGSGLEVLIRRHTAGIAEAHRAALEVADYKVTLAQQTYDLVDSHIQRLDKDLKKFEEELRREQVQIGGQGIAPGSEILTQEEAGRKNRGQYAVPVAPQVEMDLPVHPNEPTYCYCNRVSYGEMIACDNSECPIEWFHFDCVGITARPRGKWYCTDCSTVMKKRRVK